LLLTRDPTTRRIAAQILLAQACCAVVLAVAALALWGPRHALSALAGGGIALVAQVYMTLTSLRPTRTAGGALARLLMGQLVKVGLTAALFVLVGRTGKVAWLPMLATYAATLMMAVLVPAAVNRRAHRT